MSEQPSKKRILMLGAGFMQGVAIRCAHDRGWEVIAVDGNPDAVCGKDADRFEPIDLKDKESLAALALKLKAEGGLDGVFTAATDFSASVAWVAQACGLPGHTYEAALNASDKLRMRACFARERVPSPAFLGVNEASSHEVVRLLSEKKIGFPVVVKPADNMGARGCRKVVSPDGLNAAITDAIKYSRTGTAIVEEYMEGPEFSVEALVYDGEIHMTGLADRHIFFPPYFIEMGHTIPSSFTRTELDDLVKVFKKGVHVLGLTHGAAKGDVKLTKNGPMIGEIAGRLSGGYMSGWTFPYSSGIELTGAALELAVGNRPANLEPTCNFVCAERAWISIPGKAAAITGYEAARAVPFIRNVFPRTNSGDTVRFPVNNVEKCGNCIALAPERKQAINAAEEACRSVFIRLEAPNPDTEAFIAQGLCGSTAFPPDAFAVPANYDDASFVPVSFDVVTAGNPVTIPVPSGLVPYLDTISDWQGRTLRQAVGKALSIEKSLISCLGNSDKKNVSIYWKALLRGGIQAIVYVYDRDKK